MGNKKSNARGRIEIHKLKNFRVKILYPRGFLAQAAMTGKNSKRAQQIIAGIGKRTCVKKKLIPRKDLTKPILMKTGETCLLENVKGRSLYDIERTPEGKEWLQEHKNSLIGQAAEILFQHMKKGVTHRDMHAKNIIVQNRNGKPFLKIIDYTDARFINYETTEGIPHDLNTISNYIGEALITPDPQKKGTDVAEYQKQIKEKISKKLEAIIAERL